MAVTALQAAGMVEPGAAQERLDYLIAWKGRTNRRAIVESQLAAGTIDLDTAKMVLRGIMVETRAAICKTSL